MTNAPSQPPPPAGPGLVAAYGFEEGAGTSIVDSSGAANGGTIQGATWTASGKFGKALSFNGSNSRVAINDSVSLHLTNGMTLEAWVYPATLGNWDEIIYQATTGPSLKPRRRRRPGPQSAWAIRRPIRCSQRPALCR